MMKAILNSAPVQTLLAALMAGWMSLVKHTTRWEVRGEAHLRALTEGGEGLILLVWHGRLMQAIAWPRDVQPAAMLISRSREGEVVAKVTRFHRVAVIRGSSRNPKKPDQGDKGGAQALREMIRWTRAGNCMAITPDGPRGPRMRLAPGAAALARSTGAPMLGLAWSTRWKIVFGSWDRFVLPLPFGRGVMIWTEPVRVERGAAPERVEAARLEAEARLNAATRAADEACGGPVVDPAPAPAPEAATAPAGEPDAPEAAAR